jgi:hypothetical protein
MKDNPLKLYQYMVTVLYYPALVGGRRLSSYCLTGLDQWSLVARPLILPIYQNSGRVNLATCH